MGQGKSNMTVPFMSSTTTTPISVMTAPSINTPFDELQCGAKFKKNGDAIDIQPSARLLPLGDGDLNKDEIELNECHSNPSIWRRISRRCTLLIAFVLLWVVLFAVTAFIIIVSPKSGPKSHAGRWHETAIIYQIFTPTFHDSDADGVGDLKGIQLKLDSLHRIGINAIWPTPIVRTNKDRFSPEAVIDIMEVDQRLGTGEDLLQLINACHALEIKLIVDIPLTIEGGVNGISQLVDIQSGGGGVKVRAKLVEAAKRFIQLGVDGIYLTGYGIQPLMPMPMQHYGQALDELKDAIRKEVGERDIIVFSDPALPSAIPTTTTATTTMNNTLIDYRVVGLLDGRRDELLLDRLSANIKFGLELEGNVHPMWKYSSITSPRIDQIIATTTTMAALMTLVQLFLPGPALIYYGEEMALPSSTSHTDSQRGRGLMRWDLSNSNYGFSNFDGITFFSTVATNESVFDVQYDDPLSPLRAFKRMAELRASSDRIFYDGEFSIQQRDGLHIYSRFNQHLKAVYILAVNWHSDINGSALRLQLSDDLMRGVVEVMVVSAFNRDYSIGQLIDVEQEPIFIRPLQAILLRVNNYD